MVINAAVELISTASLTLASGVMRLGFCPADLEYDLFDEFSVMITI